MTTLIDKIKAFIVARAHDTLKAKQDTGQTTTSQNIRFLLENINPKTIVSITPYVLNGTQMDLSSPSMQVMLGVIELVNGCLSKRNQEEVLEVLRNLPEETIRLHDYLYRIDAGGHHAMISSQQAATMIELFVKEGLAFADLLDFFEKHRVTGYASAGALNEELMDAGQWLKANAHMYGLIMKIFKDDFMVVLQALYSASRLPTKA